MANIVGEPFDQWVSDQINNRQRVHGTKNRDNKTLSYLNSKTGWLKLTSGVVVTDYERLDRIGLSNHPSFAGPNSSVSGRTGLSKFFVLFNGTSDVDNTLFSGIDRQLDKGQSILNKTAYGLGSKDFGIRPMPGIKSGETKFRNRGSIREGNIQIKAWDRTQFEIINLLYLRLGFPMLLEWGHSIIVDSSGQINTQPDFSLSSKFLNQDFKNDNQVLAALAELREKSAGNYDAMYGKVVNFDWSFNKDGSYDITLKLISIGAVVESLKMNVYHKDDLAVDKSKSPDNTDDAPENDEDWISKFRTSHDLGSIFWHAMRLLFEKNSWTGTDKIDTINRSYLLTKAPIIKNWQDSYNTEYADYILYGLDGLDEKFYVRFGELVKLLSIMFPANADDPSNPVPIVNFLDIDLPQNKSYMYTEDWQITGNVDKCLVGGFKLLYVEDPTVFNSDKLDVNPYKKTVEGYLVGDLANVYVNMAFVLQILDERKDENGSVSFIDFIQSILDGINESLGSVNKLECIVDEDTNTAKFIDNTPIPGYEKIMKINTEKDTSAEFLIYGYYNYDTPTALAGFVRDFSLKTEITNNLATMMTIGATANKSVVGEDATAFSKWNKGLAPIIGKNIIEGTSKTDPPKTLSPDEEIEKLKKDNEQLLEDFNDYRDSLRNFDLDEDQRAAGSQLVSNMLVYRNQLRLIQAKKDNIPNPVSATSSRGFLPINLSLTLDGLSGMKIYQKLKIDTTYLPSDYPESLNFIIKGISNKIDRGGWTTVIETVSVPVISDNLTDPNPTNGVVPKKSNTLPSPTTSPDVKNTARNTKYVAQPNANKLRETLKQLGYREKGTEIDNGGRDISPEIQKAVSSVLRTIKTELPSVSVIITGGNDSYHQKLSYTSRHTLGNAIDLTVSPHDPKTLDKIVTILQRYSAGNAPNFRFIDEYRHLTKAGTGNHFHLSWGVGTESQNELNKSLSLAKQGKITPLKIA
jgi:hypothetical protein